MPISNWPYSNAQQLNLDWILQVVKQFEDDYSGIEAALNSAIQSINQKTGTSITVLEAEKNQILNAIVAAREAAVSDVTTAKTAAIGDIDTEADASVARLQALIADLPEDTAELLASIVLLADEKHLINIDNYEQITCSVSSTNTLQRSASRYKSRQIPRETMWDSIEITANSTQGTHVTFVTEALPALPTNGQDMSGALCSGETGRHTLEPSQRLKLHIPSDCQYIVICTVSNSNDANPTSVYVLPKIGTDIVDLTQLVQGKLDSTYDMPINWAEAFGDELNLLGWQTGYYNTSGATGSSSDYMRTNRRAYYTATHGDESLTFTVPSGYNAAIAEYDADGTNGTRHGNVDSGENTITIALTEGHLYKFCIGKWSGNADDDITEAFISTVTATVKRSFLEWQKEQDARLDAISGASGIPEYYAGSYLQTKLNTITTLQKSLSDKTDGFIFISDYHIRTNRGNSLALIKEVARKTGIQKIFFAGDAGGRMDGDSGYVVSMQRSAQVWSDLADCAEEFYGSLGNHEWIDGSVYGKGAMFANYLNRFKQKVHDMSANGSYYIKDPVCKIRYYFINDSWGTSALDYDWFGKSLEAMSENGWYIVVIVHHGFIPGSASKAEYDGVEIDTTTASNVIAKVLTRILQAYQAHTALTATISGTSYSWDFSGTSGGGAIGVFCGHYHHGTLFDKDDAENEWGIPVWRAGTDSMQAGTVFENYEGQKVPWYWENGVIGGTKVIRTPGTTDEQCFYTVQIDMTNKLVHITAIGGDHDWEFNFT